MVLYGAVSADGQLQRQKENYIPISYRDYRKEPGIKAGVRCEVEKACRNRHIPLNGKMPTC